MVTLDELEKAFLKDAIPESEYTQICKRLLQQYKSLTAEDTVAQAFVGLDEFKAEWEVRLASTSQECMRRPIADPVWHHRSTSLARPSEFE